MGLRVPFGPIPCVRLQGIALLAIALAGCASTGDETGGEIYTDWDRAGGCTGSVTEPWGVSLAGTALGPCMFPRHYVWVSYTALWCRSCDRQTEQVREASARRAPDTVLLTVVGGGREAYKAATDPQLREWASRTALDLRYVVSEGATGRALPQHALIGPDGHTLLRRLGHLGADEILAIVDAFRTGKRAPPNLSR